MEERMNTARRAIRDATLRAQAGGDSARSAETATTAAGAAGKRQGTVTTALADTRLLGKPRTFSGLHADRKSWRFTMFLSFWPGTHVGSHGCCLSLNRFWTPP